MTEIPKPQIIVNGNAQALSRKTVLKDREDALKANLLKRKAQKISRSEQNDNTKKEDA